MGFRTTQIIYAAAKLAIAYLLQGRPARCVSHGECHRCSSNSFYCLLRALASLGIFAETTDGRFQLTEFAQTLRSDVPGSLRGVALFFLPTSGSGTRTEGLCIASRPAYLRSNVVHGQAFFEQLALPSGSGFDL